MASFMEERARQMRYGQPSAAELRARYETPRLAEVVNYFLPRRILDIAAKEGNITPKEYVAALRAARRGEEMEVTGREKAGMLQCDRSEGGVHVALVLDGPDYCESFELTEEQVEEGLRSLEGVA